MTPTETHVEALAACVGTLQARPEDAGAVRLARGYAEELDAGGDIAKIGPAYLAALTALGLTPAARAALAGKGATADEQRANPLDELRQRRAARET